jgi:hypothetical protein
MDADNAVNCKPKASSVTATKHDCKLHHIGDSWPNLVSNENFLYLVHNKVSLVPTLVLGTDKRRGE